MLFRRTDFDVSVSFQLSDFGLEKLQGFSLALVSLWPLQGE